MNCALYTLDVSPRGKYGKFIPAIFTVVDFLLINLVYILTLLTGNDVSGWDARIVCLLINVAYAPVAFLAADTFRIRAVQMQHVMRNAILSAMGHMLIFITLLYLAGVDDIPWWMFAQYFGLETLSLLLWRTASRMIEKRFRRRGRNYSRIIIVGCGSTACRLYEQMKSDEGFGYRCLGFFDSWCPPGFPLKHLYKGNLDQLEEFVRNNAIDEVYYAIPGENEEAVKLALAVCDKHMAQFRFVPSASRYLNHRFSLSAIGQVPVMIMRNNPLSNPVNSALKRILDLTVSSVFLIFSPIIFIPVAIAIKISSPGPVFFKQKRTGYMGQEFLCWKFRTMKVNVDADTRQATKDDPRKTRLGDFLRRTSIDELPQFINVWLGNMSVVGPRPHMLKHTEDYSALIGQYMVRHIVKPGITGWAQVRGYRGQTEELWQMEKRVEHDIWYIENWTLLLDIKIIIRTVINAFQGEKNAF